jgi:NADH-quinone oxidoreductase subunit B
MVDNLNTPGYDIPPELTAQLKITTLDRIYNWGRRSSIWPMMFGLACCAIEMICTAAGRFDFARFGMEIMRPSPRQTDLMIVAGTVTKYVVAMGSCASGGGPFKEGYNVVPGIDRYLPVDVYINGCPPTPQALMHGFIKLMEKIDKQSIKNVAWYRKEPIPAIPIPILGPDVIDPRQITQIQKYTQTIAAVGNPDEPQIPTIPTSGEKA